MQLLPPLGSLALFAGATLAVLTAASMDPLEGALVRLETTAIAPSVQQGDVVDLVPVRAPLGEFSEITERPLFSPTRRPTTKKPEAPSLSAVSGTPDPNVVEQSPPEAVLLGVFTGDGTAAALVKLPEAEATWMPVDHSLGGWILVEITENHITLERGERTHRVELYRR